MEVVGLNDAVDSPTILHVAEPDDLNGEPDASVSEHFTKAIAFGHDLVKSADLDPVYVAFYGAGLDYDTRARLLLAYTCIYHLGAAVTIAEHKDSSYWNALMTAAINEGLQWPRGSERRHWRGKQALQTVTYLRESYKYPEDVVNHWANGGDNSFTAVSTRVKEIPRFGPWISFKAGDMLERCLGNPVDFSSCAMGVYSEPRAAAALILTGNQKANITDSDLDSVMQKMLLPEHLGSLYAPPARDRLVNVQECETVLCKYKSHVNGHYPPGKDTREVLHGLEDSRWENSITRRMVEVLETVPYARSTPQVTGKRKPPESETFGATIHEKQRSHQ